MTNDEFIQLMQYPKEWVIWKLLPKELIEGQIAIYEPGDENASEHYRNGAFHYWLKKNPNNDILIKLVKLSAIDPDPLMGEYLRKDYVSKAKNVDSDVLKVIREI